MATIDDKKEKNVPEKDVKSLYEIGTKVMGFHNALGSGHIIAGNINLVINSTISSQSLYQVEGMNKEFGGFLDEDEILPFNQEIFDKASNAWKEYVQSYARCHELYQDIKRYLMKDKNRKRIV